MKLALERLRASPEDCLGWARSRQPPHVALVDEAQDLDDCMLSILELVRARGPTTVVMVGDPSQAIYLFRGAHETPEHRS